MTSMLMLVTILGALFSAGVVSLVWGLLNAPEAYEDEDGFLVVQSEEPAVDEALLWRNVAPDVQDVSCIWISGCSA